MKVRNITACVLALGVIGCASESGDTESGTPDIQQLGVPGPATTGPVIDMSEADACCDTPAPQPTPVIVVQPTADDAE